MSFLNSRKRAILFALFVGSVSGCAINSSKLHYSMGEREKATLPTKIVVLPIDITVDEVSARGLREEAPEWSTQASENVLAEIEKEFAKHTDIALRKMPQQSAKNMAIIDEHIALYDIVAGSALNYTRSGGAAWEHKNSHFDYTIGNGLSFLRKKTGANAALIVIGHDSVATTGRKFMEMLTLALTGATAYAGRSYLTAGIVDLRTGDLLWLNSRIAGNNNAGFKEPIGAESMVYNLFEELPGNKRFRQAALDNQQ